MEDAPGHIKYLYNHFLHVIGIHPFADFKPNFDPDQFIAISCDLDEGFIDHCMHIHDNNNNTNDDHSGDDDDDEGYDDECYDVLATDAEKDGLATKWAVEQAVRRFQAERDVITEGMFDDWLMETDKLRIQRLTRSFFEELANDLPRKLRKARKQGKLMHQMMVKAQQVIAMDIKRRSSQHPDVLETDMECS